MSVSRGIVMIGQAPSEVDPFFSATVEVPSVFVNGVAVLVFLVASDAEADLEGATVRLLIKESLVI